MYCGVDTNSPEWAKLSSNTEGVGLFEAVKDAVFRSNGIVRPVEDVVRSIIQENPSRALEYKDRFPKIAAEFINAPVKAEVEDLFQSNPELAAIGTPGQYSQYIDSIFPDSKVKDIVYHGTEEVFEKFEYTKEKLGPSRQNQGLEEFTGMFWFSNKEGALNYGNTIPAVLNMVNPANGSEYIVKYSPYDREDPFTDSLSSVEKGFAEKDGYDSFYGYSVDMIPERIVFAPEQIHILGNKTDLEGFRNYLKSNKTQEYTPQFALGTNGPLGTEVDLFIANNLLNSVETSIMNTFSKEAESSFVTDAVNELIGTLTDTYGNQVGVNFITAEQAKEMHAAQNKTYGGQKAFFNNGAVYFVSKNITRKDVFHEFSHPFVKSLRADNKKVYDKLISDAMSTEEGSLIFQETLLDNPGVAEDSPYIQDEFLVRALTEAYMSIVRQEPVTKEFNNAIKNIFYRLRQLLRKLFGKSIDLKDLSETSTLEEVAKMILENKIDLNTEAITEQDVFDYISERDKAIDEALRLGSDAITKQISATYFAASQTLERLAASYNASELLNAIKDRYSKNELETIKRNLSEHTSEIIEAGLDEAELMKKVSIRAQVYVSNLRRLKNVMERIAKDAREKTKLITDPKSSVDAMYALTNYKELGSYWNNYIRFAMDQIDNPANNEYIGTDSPLYSLVTSIRSEIEKLNAEINKVNSAAIGPVLYEQLQPMAEAIDEKYERNFKFLEDRIAKAEGSKKAGLEKDLAKLKEKYEAIRLTPEKFKMILSGELGDAGQFNSLLEGYLHNQDPVTASFAMFTKNNLADVDLNFSKFQRKFNKDIGPKMRAAGLDNPLDPAAVGRATTFLDKSYMINEDGRVEQYQVYSFISPVKDYRYTTAIKEQEIEDMRLEAQKSGDKAKIDAWRKAKADYKKYKVKYFWQEYSPEVYEPDFLIDETPEGREAREEYNDKWNEINAIDKTFYSDPNEYQQALERKKILQREQSQMLSSKYSDNTPKSERDAKKAELLRNWINEKRKFRKRVLRQGAFQTAITDFMQNLVNSGVDQTSDEFTSAVRTFISENTQVKYTEEYDNKVKNILAEIAKIDSKYPKEGRNTFSEDQQYIKDIQKQYTDPETGELLGQEIPEDIVKKVKEAQDRINASKKNKATRTLSDEDAKEYNRIKGIFDYNRANPNNKKRITEEDIDEFNRISALLQPTKLSKADRIARNALYAELAKLRSKVVSEQYLDIWNTLLQDLDTDDLYAYVNSRIITRDNIDLVLENVQLLQDLSLQGKQDGTPDEQIQYASSRKLNKFLLDNHSLVPKYENGKRAGYDVYEPIDIWRRTSPSDETSYMQTTYTDLNGNEVAIPNRAPSAAYWSSIVDPKYLTPYEVGRTVDNTGRGSKAWLPRAKEDDAPADSPFINELYYDIKQNNTPLFDLLQSIKRLHLEQQEKKPRGSRLYLDAPRFRIEGGLVGGSVEQYRDLKNAPTRWWQNVRDFFKVAKDDVDQEGLNPMVQKGIMLGDLFDDDNDGIPVHGISQIDHEIVSLEVTNTILRYGYSLEMQKKLLEINPIAKALKDTLRDPRTGDYRTIQPIQKMNKRYAVGANDWLDDKTSSKRAKKGKNLRAKNIDNFYEWVYLGKNNTGFGSQKWIVNLTNKLFKRASLGFFGLNIDSALVNYFDAIIQNNIEAAAGKYMNMLSYQKGLARASMVMGNLSWSLYHDEGDRPLDLQVSMIFDPGQGMFKKHLGRDLTRNLARDAAEMTWLTSTRQWLDMQAQMSVLWGMLSHKRIPQMDGGTEKMINYADAWEIKDGVATLKEGIDLEYGAPVNHIIAANDTLESIAEKYNVPIERLREYNRLKSDDLELLDKKTKDAFIISKGTEFKKFRNQVQGVITNVNGAFATLDQPEANRYVVYRYINFLQKYFTRGMMRRFAHRGRFWDPAERYDIGLGDTDMGYYVRALNALKRNMLNLRNGALYLTDEEKQATYRMLTEAAHILLNAILIRLLFGFDMDDDDKYEKLRQRSGPMPGFMVDDDNPAFHFDGFLANHALLILLKTRSNAESWIPLPGLGLDDYSQKLAVTSAVYGTTFEAYVKILTSIIPTLTDDPSAFYKRDIGPYSFQKEGGSKLANYFFKSIGITGNNVDPNLAIRNFVQIEKKKGGGTGSILNNLLSNLPGFDAFGQESFRSQTNKTRN